MQDLTITEQALVAALGVIAATVTSSWAHARGITVTRDQGHAISAHLVPGLADFVRSLRWRSTPPLSPELIPVIENLVDAAIAEVLGRPSESDASN